MRTNDSVHQQFQQSIEENKQFNARIDDALNTIAL